MDTLRGVIERITFHNEENGYTVAKLTPERPVFGLTGRGFGRSNEVAIVGNMMGVNVGESVELRGQWTVHAEYGKQFQVQTMQSVLPATAAGLEKYLGSGLIKGIGPVTARRIVRHFGLETLEIIEEAPERLLEVPGIGRKRTRLITQAWAEQRAIKEVMIFLQSHGVSTGLATKIYKVYGDDAINVVRQDPYRLAREIYGIGFLTADKIAKALGLPHDAPQRVAAGVAHTLNQATDNGHVYLPVTELAKNAAELLEVTPDQVGIGIVQLWQSDQVKVVDPESMAETHHPDAAQGGSQAQDGIPRLVAEGGGLYAASTVEQARTLLGEEQAVYLTPLFFSEQGVTSQIKRLLQAPGARLSTFAGGRFDWETAFVTLERDSNFTLAPQQRKAVQTALNRRLTILTGGPGTGKTTTVRTILDLCRMGGHRVLLAAPTGRAAKRLAETTGQEAKTIHRLLEFKPADGVLFQRNAESPLSGDLLIVDEASMLDLVLTNHLLKAVPDGMHLLLVGDVDQLPSVGAGNVLKDIIAAIEGADPAVAGDRVPGEAAASPWSQLFADEQGTLRSQAAVVRLETIFRQAAGSYIITNAHRINRGLLPIWDNEQSTDFFLFRTDDPARAAQLCVELVQSRIPRRFGFSPEEIQVLSPMHRGVVGVGALNSAIQAAINPPDSKRAERAFGGRIIRVGDRVMQVRNNYDKDVYNGDMGAVRKLDSEMQQIEVEFDGRTVLYDFVEQDELLHAFAVSVHKSQGSEFPAVVIPVLTTHYMMLQRNLLYTAVTRAQRLVVLVGQPKAIGIAVRNNQVTMRYTGLCNRLAAA